MNKLRNCVQSGLKFNSNFTKLGKSHWRQPETIPGFLECKKASENMTWQDCINVTGLNPDECFNEELSTHVIYEMNKVRIMLIFFKGGVTVPIHDHESMVVFCKCIKGKIGVDYWDYNKSLDDVKKHIKTQDYENLKMNGVPVSFNGSFEMEEGKLDIIKPFENNLHRFRPQKNSVILD